MRYNQDREDGIGVRAHVSTTGFPEHHRVALKALKHIWRSSVVVPSTEPIGLVGQLSPSPGADPGPFELCLRDHASLETKSRYN